MPKGATTLPTFPNAAREKSHDWVSLFLPKEPRNSTVLVLHRTSGSCTIGDVVNGIFPRGRKPTPFRKKGFVTYLFSGREDHQSQFRDSTPTATRPVAPIVDCNIAPVNPPLSHTPFVCSRDSTNSGAHPDLSTWFKELKVAGPPIVGIRAQAVVVVE